MMINAHMGGIGADANTSLLFRYDKVSSPPSPSCLNQREVGAESGANLPLMKISMIPPIPP